MTNETLELFLQILSFAWLIYWIAVIFAIRFVYTKKRWIVRPIGIAISVIAAAFLIATIMT